MDGSTTASRKARQLLAGIESELGGGRPAQHRTAAACSARGAARGNDRGWAAGEPID